MRILSFNVKLSCDKSIKEKTMNIETVLKNDERYVGFKDFCKSLTGPFISDSDCMSVGDKNNNKVIDKLLFAIESTKDFNINDVVHNYHGKYRFTTPLEFVLKTENPRVINFVLEKYINEIENDIFLNDFISYKLLNVLYSNLEMDNCITDTITPLVYKFEYIDFIDEVSNFELKLTILRYFIEQKENYISSELFINKIENKYKEVLKEQEKQIFKQFFNSINKYKSLTDKLICDQRYEASNEMKEFIVLINSQKINQLGDNNEK